MSFDTLAPHYRWLEVVLAGDKLQRCRTAFLDAATDCRHVLILGEGNGRFLAECRRRLASARITCVDASARMLALTRRRLLRLGLGSDQTAFIQADALTWTPPTATFDLVVTHFFLDCFRPDQLESLMDKVAAATTASAIWLLADFQLPASGLARLRALGIHFLMYGFFRVATRLPARRLTAPDPLLKFHGFTLRTRQISDWGLLHSDLWQRR